ncbi:MAG: glycosyltransferase [Thaumarchaeota archaeon]|nr:glycosyltransferase [Nitrososphaerota archaeon]
MPRFSRRSQAVVHLGSESETRASEGKATRVLLICDFGPGLLRHVLETYAFMSDTRVTLVRRRMRRVALPAGVRLVTVPVPVIGASDWGEVSKSLPLLLNTASYLLLGSLLSTLAAFRFRCGVVHARFLFPEGIVGLVVSALSGAKLVATAEGFDVNLHLRNRLARAALAMIARRGEIISVSKPIFEQLSSFGVTSRYLPNGLDTSRFKFVRLDKKESLVIFVGMLEENKRPQLLVEAVSRIRPFIAQEGIKVRIIGEGPLRDTIKRRIDELGLEDCISLEGFLGTESIVDFMAKAYAYVSCSATEGLSLAMLEAMASGPVVVATDIPATRALITNTETGFTFPPDDADGLAQAIKFVFEHSSETSGVTARARKLVESTYEVRNGASELSRIYAGSGPANGVGLL